MPGVENINKNEEIKENKEISESQKMDNNINNFVEDAAKLKKNAKRYSNGEEGSRERGFTIIPPLSALSEKDKNDGVKKVYIEIGQKQTRKLSGSIMKLIQDDITITVRKEMPKGETFYEMECIRGTGVQLLGDQKLGYTVRGGNNIDNSIITPMTITNNNDLQKQLAPIKERIEGMKKAEKENIIKLANNEQKKDADAADDVLKFDDNKLRDSNQVV